MQKFGTLIFSIGSWVRLSRWKTLDGKASACPMPFVIRIVVGSWELEIGNRVDSGD